MDYVNITSEGLQKLKTEYAKLVAERPGIVEHLKTAREMGDLRENGYYKSYRMKLNSVDHRILYLKELIKKCRIMEVENNGTVNFGCVVRIKSDFGQKSFKLVSKYEANPSENRISDISPIGTALLGKKKGDKIIINTPSGSITWTVVGIHI